MTFVMARSHEDKDIFRLLHVFHAGYGSRNILNAVQVTPGFWMFILDHDPN